MSILNQIKHSEEAFEDAGFKAVSQDVYCYDPCCGLVACCAVVFGVFGWLF